MERQPYDRQTHFDLWEAESAGHTSLDAFCSSPYWGDPVHRAFQPSVGLYCYTGSSCPGLAVFAERTVLGGRQVLPPDPMWLLGCPLLSENPSELFSELLDYWISNPLEEGIRQVLISGLYADHPFISERAWSPLGGWEIESSARMVASLDGGVDGFMSRRSKNFRSRLRRTVKAAADLGIEVEYLSHHPDATTVSEILKRIFSLETKSWKGRLGRGIDRGNMRSFYEFMIPLLAQHSKLRGLFLQRDGTDVAYLFGGVFNDYFRGLQFSYSNDETLGLGNVCQYHMICQLVDEGQRFYDLGQAMDYKRRWAESEIVSRSFVFQL